MRTWLADAPRWVVSVVAGAIFGVGMAASQHFQQGSSWQASLAYGAVLGVVFGFVMGWVSDRQRQRLRAAVGPLLTDARVRRAVRRGPAPEDPEVRQAALRSVEQQLAQTRRQRGWVLPVFAVFCGLYLYLAVTDSAWWWLAGAFFAGMFLLSLLLPRWLTRRRAVLASPGQGPLS